VISETKARAIGRFYDRMIPLADDFYDEHLVELQKEKDDGR
jgi:hypothetical protein